MFVNKILQSVIYILRADIITSVWCLCYVCYFDCFYTYILLRHTPIRYTFNNGIYYVQNKVRKNNNNENDDTHTFNGYRFNKTRRATQNAITITNNYIIHILILYKSYYVVCTAADDLSRPIPYTYLFHRPKTSSAIQPYTF